MSDTDALVMTVDIEDHGRTVHCEISLPTWEGSDGPSLDTPDWSQQVSDLAQRVMGAACAALSMLTPAADRLAELALGVAELRDDTKERLAMVRRLVSDELVTLDETVDAAHQRLDAIHAPDMIAIKNAREAMKHERAEAVFSCAKHWRLAQVANGRLAEDIDGIGKEGDVLLYPQPGAVLLVHTESGNTWWLTAEEAARRVRNGLLDSDPEDEEVVDDA